jgi:hypothetical protein
MGHHIESIAFALFVLVLIIGIGLRARGLK